MAEQKSSQQVAESEPPSTAQGLPQPLRAAASVLGKVPGAGTVGRVAGGALDRVGAMSPRGRRFAVYAGAGVLGVAGVVEWPVAVTGAAVAWLTQPRPGEHGESGDESRPTPRVLASSHGTAPTTSRGTSVSSSPSDKLPPHETASPSGRGGPGGATTGRTRSGD
ncbi:MULTISPECIES: hypothetical protein [Streptomyces]|uniref:Uncharacterized protein n=1 Tax=Streptomyces doebereineriae TaxID=3075528 RepID=A0ABU2VDM0_9ACTN|nr:hypothetical protein [Streptomyces sp. DSM 41640]MDT0483668.1 hypothetical protein [Streptomyces sp. DSM 41640]